MAVLQSDQLETFPPAIHSLGAVQSVVPSVQAEKSATWHWQGSLHIKSDLALTDASTSATYCLPSISISAFQPPSVFSLAIYSEVAAQNSATSSSEIMYIPAGMRDMMRVKRKRASWKIWKRQTHNFFPWHFFPQPWTAKAPIMSM